MEDQKIKVLYVDDEENNLVSFRAAMRRYFDIYTAISAEEGMNILHEVPIPIIITDQRMPEITGINDKDFEMIIKYIRSMKDKKPADR